MDLFFGFVDLPQEKRTPWDDDKLVAQVNSVEAARAAKRLFPDSKWWRGSTPHRQWLGDPVFKYSTAIPIDLEATPRQLTESDIDAYFHSKRRVDGTPPQVINSEQKGTP